MTGPDVDPPAVSELAGVPCRVERRVWAGVPCLIERPLTDGPYQAVCVVFHGAWASKEGKLGVYSALTAHNVLVVLPDAALHGERVRETPPGHNAREQVWESVARTVAEGPSLLDGCLKEFGDVPVWLVGSSMGGYVALTLARMEQRVQKVAAVITTGVWHEPQVRLPHLIRFLEEHRPLTHAPQFPPTPLLLISGGSDPAFPLHTHHEPTATALREAYAAARVSGRFREAVVPGAAHYTSRGIREQVLSFLLGHEPSGGT